MDIQGYELEALKGMTRILQEDRPIIIFEFWPFGIENCEGKPIAVLELLSRAGYTLEHLDTKLPNPDSQREELLHQLKSMKGGKGFCSLKATPIKR